ncbi:MAG: hypothetical protein HZC40_10985 [Chloroflexi bacterium]|nr:hypothetical protein [Chloroflexota bacterium]
MKNKFFAGVMVLIALALFLGLGADQVLRLDQEDKFVGRGTAMMVPCDTGRCQSAHLSWQGGFPTGGPYFVQVLNPTDRWLTMQLFIGGTGVSLGPVLPPTPTPTATLVPAPVVAPVTAPVTTTTPTTTTILPTTPVTPVVPVVVAPPVVPVAPVVPVVPVEVAPKNDSPYFAIMVPDNREQTVAAGSRLWYKFGYGGDKTPVLVVLRLGNAIGVGFRVYTQEQADKYTDQKFIGIGTTGKIACETGRCTSDDLSWKGGFPVPGSYYIEVVNNTDKERTFVLNIQGTNIDIEE